MKDIATLAIPATALCRLLQYADAHQAELNAGELAALAIEEKSFARQYPRHRLPSRHLQSFRACCHRPLNAFLGYHQFRPKRAYSKTFMQARLQTVHSSIHLIAAKSTADKKTCCLTKVGRPLGRSGPSNRKFHFRSYWLRHAATSWHQVALTNL